MPDKNRDKQIKPGQFRPGQSGNPDGRPTGSKNHDGLQAVLSMLKDLVSKDDNLKKLEETLQEELNKHPMRFYRSIVMPLFPRNISIEGSLNLKETPLNELSNDELDGRIKELEGRKTPQADIKQPV